ncbi:lamin tail domain-containing protein [Inmirania thermothiophila]|uniref:Lamin tail-like protein n=1 Tax=Inmirania thermothiophila TaxID=1750597 RepID=A0A3N1XS92_9GAMM|nr:lamin tail domain-containing protein [Inmirania thermothiophila]ROR29506.1 lamin tail-like protein [Inmirania thermothiophila]
MRRSLLPLALVLGLAARTAAGTVLISEIDYDQPGADEAEFIELHNPDGAAASLDGHVLELVNGADGSVYRSAALDGLTIAAGGFLVLCGNPARVPTCDLDIGPATHLIQNGPDAARLVAAGLVLDAVAWEGVVAGLASIGSDDPAVADLALARIPAAGGPFRPTRATPGGAPLPLPPPWALLATGLLLMPRARDRG